MRNQFGIRNVTPLKMYNGTALAVPLEIQGQPLPINELNGEAQTAYPISNLHRCRMQRIISHYYNHMDKKKDILFFTPLNELNRQALSAYPISNLHQFIRNLRKKWQRTTRNAKTNRNKTQKYKEPIAMLSRKSKMALSQLYKEIQSVQRVIHYQIEEIPSEKIKSPHSYIPKEIHDSLNVPKAARRATIQIGQRKIVIECVIPFTSKKGETEKTLFENRIKIDEFFGDCVYKIYLWLSVAMKYAPAHCSNTIHIYLYMTPLTKVLPEIANQPIDTVHANTAFTTSCAPTTEINVFRREEWFKVFIHETFHSLGLDFSEMDTTKANAKICSLFRVKSDVRLFETFCEMWAEIIHDMFYLYLEKKTSLQKMPAALIDCIANEKLFSVFQCVKVLQFFGLRYQDLFEEGVAREKYKERTQVLSYYVLKSVAMVFMNDFVEWCLEHNPKNMIFFEKTEENVESYCEFFVSHSQLPKYKKMVEMAETILKEKQLKEKQGIPDFIKNTLRMSVYS
jgi:hypothetical protein